MDLHSSSARGVSLSWFVSEIDMFFSFPSLLDCVVVDSLTINLGVAGEATDLKEFAM